MGFNSGFTGLKELLCKAHASHYLNVKKLEMKGLHETWNHFNCRNGVRGPTCIRSAKVWSFKLHSKSNDKCIYIHLSFCIERCRSLLSISKRSNYVLLRIYSRTVKTLLHTAVLCSSSTQSPLCQWLVNPLAYTDVPETAGLARSINP